MPHANQSRWLGWAILLVCLLAVPAGIFGREHKKDVAQTGAKSSHWSSFLSNQDHLVVLRLYGAITDADDTSMFPQTDTAGWVKRKLRHSVDEDNIKGILIRINSPGGTVGMSQEVYDAVQAVRAKNKVVVVSMGDMAASGGYYIASAADKIYANPGTLTGSIGVIMHLLNWQETEKKIGLQPGVIKSGAFKDIGSPDREMTPAEKEILQNIIMDSYDQFVSAVAQGRKMDKEQVKKLADGRVYSGRQAFKVKLVDELGGYDDALASLQKTCRKKFKLSEDLPVDDGSSSVLSAFLPNSESKTDLPAALKSSLKQMLPMSMNPEFNRVPLWVME